MKLLIPVLFLFSVYALALSGTSYDPKRSDELNKSSVNLDGKKIMGTVSAGTTADIDLVIADDAILTGARTMITGKCDLDEIQFKVVSGTTVVNTFIDWFASDTTVELSYPAKIPAGLKLRITYKNTCSMSAVTVKVNYLMHKVLL